MRTLLFHTPPGDLAGSQVVRDQQRFTLFCDNALTECQTVQQDMDKTGAGPRHRRTFSYLFRGIDLETGKTYTQIKLEVESRLIIKAGSDTSSTGLASCCFHLVRNKQVLDKLTKEICSVFANVEDITYAGNALPHLPYLPTCIGETLRISPPVLRHLPSEVGPGGATVDGMFFPPDTVVSISTYALHHKEEYYPDPSTYSPERWIVNATDDVSARVPQGGSRRLQRSVLAPEHVLANISLI